jgi:hypothetical protein
VAYDAPTFWVAGDADRVISTNDFTNWKNATGSSIGDIFASALVAPGLIVFGGSDEIDSYDSGMQVWTTELPSVEGWISGMWLAPDGYVAASVSSDSAISARTRDPNGSWSTLLGSAGDMNSVFAVGTEVYLVGANGAIQHLVAGVWQNESVGGPDDLNGVWASSASDVWAVGDSGTILRSHGDGAWSSYPSMSGSNLNAVWGSGPTDIYIVGGSGTILQFSP